MTRPVGTLELAQNHLTQPRDVTIPSCPEFERSLALTHTRFVALYICGVNTAPRAPDVNVLLCRRECRERRANTPLHLLRP